GDHRGAESLPGGAAAARDRRASAAGRQEHRGRADRSQGRGKRGGHGQADLARDRARVRQGEARLRLPTQAAQGLPGAPMIALRDAREKAGSLDRLTGDLEKISAQLISEEVAQPDLKSWRSALDQTLQSRLNASRQRSDISARERELQRKSLDLRRKLQRLGA